jgi:hypothetical protein
MADHVTERNPCSRARQLHTATRASLGQNESAFRKSPHYLDQMVARDLVLTNYYLGGEQTVWFFGEPHKHSETVVGE